jgi:hypothetical protein
MNQLKLNVIAAIGVLLSAVAAQAQVNVNYGDLVLGFRNTGAGSGQSSNLEVDLGAFSNFNLLNGQTITLSGPNGLAVQDLVNTYGASWNTNSGLLWSVASTSDSAGVPGLADNTLFVTSTGTAFKRQSSAIQQTASDNIGNFIQSLNFTTATANSTVSSVIDTTNTGTANYTGGITGNGGFPNSYNATTTSLMTLNNVERNTNITSGFVSLNLYELAPTVSGTANGLLLGTFKLFSDGTLTFTATAVPEPSTWAAGALVALGMVGFTLRRRARKTA